MCNRVFSAIFRKRSVLPRPFLLGIIHCVHVQCHVSATPYMYSAYIHVRIPICTTYIVYTHIFFIDGVHTHCTCFYMCIIHRLQVRISLSMEYVYSAYMLYLVFLCAHHTLCTRTYFSIRYIHVHCLHVVIIHIIHCMHAVIT